ncbi:CO or xanthine dehydrogenase, FAD-binding subunit [Dethiosulfatibacter aminovorans DSM 17477]|uniref:CO or xanthine dehydrogenase, FAD-binding subunit n=1 Tax=Dethiosulfatibacter aminovorans DSM 17477 TaxID=1121476 RepID=A0A1M6HBB1_9FIRM|nr:FAD binding domain-containing protein [Dethiosulfatibacter aminovorans]SHJ19517.1 CO or xanthine dehydrogenase, FAD-binding subunit [Dethiosulfatibacter aminovorans DSM 17477]
MIRIRSLNKPKTMEEAWELYSKNKKAKLIAGGAFLRLSTDLYIGEAIDLFDLNLNGIRETENEFTVGAMTTLRQLETDASLNSYFNNYFSKSLENIVGVQLRNIATIGGTVYPRYGFSDLLTALLALDVDLQFYKAGRMNLQEYMEKGLLEKDILVEIIIKKNIRNATFEMMRNSKGDYAILNCGISLCDCKYRISIGGRPGRAVVAEEAMEILNAAEEMGEETIGKACDAVAGLTYGTNMLGSGRYRSAVSKVLLKRGIMEVLENDN